MHGGGVLSNVISVPDGASDKKLLWVEDLEEELKQFKRIVLLTDGDSVGIAMRNELARRLGRHRCWRVDWPEGCKDPNDMLVGYGAEKFKEFVDGAEPWPLKALHETRSYVNDAFALLNGDVKTGVSTGINALDLEL
jgi:twinkle protein